MKKLIDQGPYTPKAAAQGWPDRPRNLAYEQTFTDEIKKSPQCRQGDGGAELRPGQAGRTRRDEAVHEDGEAPPKMSFSLKPKIAVIYATGAINSGKSGQSILGGASCGSPETMIEAIRQADEDSSVKAIVLRVDRSRRLGVCQRSDVE